MTSRDKVWINLTCTAEQWVLLVGSVWLVYWRGFSAWTFLVALILGIDCSPQVVLKALGVKDEQA